MARRPEPWFWEERGKWVIQWKGERLPLAKGPKAKTKAEAYRAYHVLMAGLEAAEAEERAAAGGTVGGRRPPGDMAFGKLADLFLSRPDSEVRANTRANHRFYLGAFRARHEKTPVGSLRVHQVRRWLESKATWSESTRGIFVQVFKACLNWGVREGYLAANPVEALPMPTISPKPPERLMSAAQLAAIIGAIEDERFRELAVFIVATGCRPSEAAAIEAKDIDLPRHQVVLKEHKTSRKTRKDRRIMLDGIALDIARRLYWAEPVGPIFKNREKNAWTPSAICKRLNTLRRRGVDIPKYAGLYSARHVFITDLLAANVPVAVVAALAGNSLAVISKNYDHTGERTDVLRDALAKIRDLGRPEDESDRA